MQLTLILHPGTRPAPAPTTPEPVLVRPIRASDLDAVGELYWRSYPDGEVGDKADAVADVRASWAGAYGTWLPNASLLAEVDGCPVATVLTVDRPPWRDVSDLVFIIDLFTSPAHRRRGLASLLVSAAITAIDPARVVGLRVDSGNEPAATLYRSMGFQNRD